MGLYKTYPQIKAINQNGKSLAKLNSHLGGLINTALQFQNN
jgi:hypothetical protein